MRQISLLIRAGAILGAFFIASAAHAQSFPGEAGAATLGGNPSAAQANPRYFTIQGLTARGAPNAANDQLVIVDAATGTLKKITPADIAAVLATGVASVNGQTGNVIGWAPPQGRMTLASNTPVMTASQAAQGTAYYTSYNGGKNVPIYNGTQIAPYQLCPLNTVGACELSVVMGANFLANTIYPGFIGVDAGTVRFCFGPAWISSGVGTSSRGTGAGTSELEPIDGLQTNKVSMTCRYANASTFTCAVHQCTYVGEMLTGNAGQSNYIFGASGSGGVAGNFGIWNMYNRVGVSTRVTDNGAAYTYTTATIRQARASAGNQISFIRGIAEDGVSATALGQVSTLAVATALGQSGLGLNSTTTYDPPLANLVYTGSAASVAGVMTSVGHYNPVVGLNTISRNETGDGVNANNFNPGSNSSLSAVLFQ